MKVALVYDHLNKLGGAEVILTQFHHLYPNATWFTSVFDKERAPFAREWKVTTSWISKLPQLRTRHEWLPWLMPFVFESFDFSQYELVISIGSAECKGIITRPGTHHLHYSLTPTRYLYSHSKEYLTHPLYRTVARPLRAWDQVASTRPDVMIAISHHVKTRIKKYYNRTSRVIYPPVNVERFAPHHAKATQSLASYYLTVSRLVPYKRLDLLVETFNTLRRPLVIVGEGSESAGLRRLAHDSVKFTGLVSDAELLSYYHHCRAFVQVNEEDFGIAMVEAQAAGKPVISLARGGGGEIVKHGETGILFGSQSKEGLSRALDAFETMNFKASACIKNAKRFDSAIWQGAMRAAINKLCQANP